MIQRPSVVMHRSVFIALIWLFGWVTPTFAAATVTTEAAVSAVQRYICFEAFWWGRTAFPFGKTVAITLRRTGDIAYAWSDGLSGIPGMPRSADFFTIFTKDGITAVADSFSYNTAIPQEAPDFQKNKNKVFGNGAETIQLLIPTDCIPHFAADTPQKIDMLKSVEATMTDELSLFNKSAGTHYPARLQIVIANFDPDYPETQVLIPSTGEVYHVSFRSPLVPPIGALTGQGSLAVGQAYRRDEIEALTQNITRYGVVRALRLP